MTLLCSQKFLLQMSLFYNFIINKYPSAILAYYNFLPRFDIQLPLGRNLVEATTAGIPLNRHDSKTIARIGTDSLIGSK